MSGALQADAFPLPVAIGRYRVIARLQRDAVGEVLRAFDPMIERPVVIKVFFWRLDDLEARGEVAQRFYQEMQRIGVLVHPGIVPLFDVGESADGLFMASEYVEGESLASLLERGADIDMSSARRFESWSMSSFFSITPSIQRDSVIPGFSIMFGAYCFLIHS